nr:protein-glutamine glutaminase family protein [Legionella norrlandica]
MLSLPFFIFCSLANSTVSQKRFPEETFQEAITRVTANEPKMLIAKGTPLSRKVPLQRMDYSIVPTVSSYEELLYMFNMIRDTRFLYSPEKPDFERRISWLYPDDGCFARAALSRAKLENEHLVAPAKFLHLVI